jgi:Reverse transcriptase (RNA-dependent DNA polymerase)
MKCEFHAMESKGVWKMFPLSYMRHGRKLVGNRWVYAEKDKRSCRSKTVALDLSQVPGKDSAYSHAPVMTNLAFRLALIIKVLNILHTGHFDIETASMYSELNKGIYMRLPDGYVKCMVEVHDVTIDPTTHVLLLKKAICGLVQATRHWWKHLNPLWVNMTATRVNQILVSLSRKQLMEHPFHLSSYTLMMVE